MSECIPRRHRLLRYLPHSSIWRKVNAFSFLSLLKQWERLGKSLLETRDAWIFWFRSLRFHNCGQIEASWCLGLVRLKYQRDGLWHDGGFLLLGLVHWLSFRVIGSVTGRCWCALHLTSSFWLPWGFQLWCLSWALGKEMAIDCV